MVGGVVIGLTRLADKTHVNVGECSHYLKHTHGACPNLSTCCVYTDEVKVHGGDRVEINIGDSLWWQGDYRYWTPQANRGLENGRGGVTYDIKLCKLGFSH